MAVMTRFDFAKELEEGLNTVFGMEYDDYPVEYTQVFNVESSKKAYEEDVLLTGFGYASEKAEGDAFAEDAGKEGWTKRYTHRTVGLSFLVTEEAVEDHLYMQIGPKYAKALARSIAQTTEVYAANVLNYAVTAGYTGGDGVVLLSASHPTVGAGLQSNLIATTDFGETGLESALTLIRKMKDDRGLPIMAKALRVIGPPDLQWVIRKVMETASTPFSADNTKNVVRDAISTEAAILTNLTDADAWFVKTDVMDGLKFFDRTSTVVPKATVDPSTGNIRYRARKRFSEGWSGWRGVVGSQGNG